MEGLIQRMSQELPAKAVILLHVDGRILHRSGWVAEQEYPAMAALVVGMIAAGKSLGEIGESFRGTATRFHCESDAVSLYCVALNAENWLAVVYDQPANPGLYRMNVRRYAETLARLDLPHQEQWDLPQNGIMREAHGAKTALVPSRHSTPL